jgi:hypothetical protein
MVQVMHILMVCQHVGFYLIASQESFLGFNPRPNKYIQGPRRSLNPLYHRNIYLVSNYLQRYVMHTNEI